MTQGVIVNLPDAQADTLGCCARRALDLDGRQRGQVLPELRRRHGTGYRRASRVSIALAPSSAAMRRRPSSCVPTKQRRTGKSCMGLRCCVVRAPSRSRSSSNPRRALRGDHPRTHPCPCSHQVDEYIAAFPPAVQATLRKVRQTVRAAAPEAREIISYDAGAETHGVLVYFAAFKEHMGSFRRSEATRSSRKRLRGTPARRATASSAR